MRVTSEHHAKAKELFTNGANTPLVQDTLMKEYGLTRPQANSACRTARKHLGIYKGVRKERKAAARRAREEAERQAEIKTKVDQD